MNPLSDHDMQRLAELADKYDFIRDAITPTGLELLEKHRRSRQSWWVRVWYWIRRK